MNLATFYVLPTNILIDKRWISHGRINFDARGACNSMFEMSWR